MHTASLAVLEYASKYKESLLFNRYMAGRDQIARGLSEAPFAYFIPQEQRDPVAAVELLRRLAFGGVRVSQLTAPATVGGETFPAGTWVVPTDQEFAAMARQVLNVQNYPDMRQYPGGPPMRPYDAAGWTLPLQMGVRVVAATTPLADEVRASLKLLGPAPDPRRKPVPYNSTESRDAAPFDSVPGIGFDSNPNAAAIVPPAGRVTGSGPDLSVDPAQNNAFRAINRAWKDATGASVQLTAGTSGARYIISGLSEPAAGRAGAGAGARGGAHDSVRNAAAAPAHRPLPSLGFEHGRGVDALAARTVRLRHRHAPAGRFSRAAPAEGGRRHPGRGCTDSRRGRGGGGRGRGAGPGGGGRASVRPSTPTS